MKWLPSFISALLIAAILLSCSAARQTGKGPQEKRSGEVAEKEKTTTVPGKTPAPDRAARSEDERKFMDARPAETVGVEKKDEKAEWRQKTGVLLEKKEYLLALNLIGKERRDALETEYLAAINGLMGAGEESLNKEQYDRAGIAFKKVLDYYPEKSSLKEKVKRRREEIESYLEISSEKLMIQGLSEYREGKLHNAIELWKKILLFDPEHQAAKKAIGTATLQLRNLKSIEEQKK